MNKLLLVSMLVMLCIANINATRFLEDTVVEQELQETKVSPQSENEQKPPQNTQQQNDNSTDNQKVIADNKGVEELVKDEQQNTTEPEKPKNEQANPEQNNKEDTIVIPQEDNKGTKKEAEENQEAKNDTEKNKEAQKDTEDNKEAKKDTEEQKEDEKVITPAPENKDSNYFGLSFGFIFVLAASVLFFFVGFYRYSLRKYKIPPFTPPTFCPNFLFPRPENDLLMEDYCIQSGTEMGGVYSSEKYHNFY